MCPIQCKVVPELHLDNVLNCPLDVSGINASNNPMPCEDKPGNEG